MFSIYKWVSGIIRRSSKSLNITLGRDEAVKPKYVVEKLWQWFILKGLSAVLVGMSFFPGWQNCFSLFLSGFTCCPKYLA